MLYLNIKIYDQSSDFIRRAAFSTSSAASDASSSAASVSSSIFCSANAAIILALIFISSNLDGESVFFFRMEARLVNVYD